MDGGGQEERQMRCEQNAQQHCCFTNAQKMIKIDKIANAQQQLIKIVKIARRNLVSFSSFS